MTVFVLECPRCSFHLIGSDFGPDNPPGDCPACSGAREPWRVLPQSDGSIDTTTGFTIKEVWDLDITIAKFTLPRLRLFKREVARVTYKPEKFLAVLDEIEWMLTCVEAGDHCFGLSEEERKRFDKACVLWGKKFTSLWL